MTDQHVHIYGPSFSTFVRSVMLVCEEKNIDYSVGTEVNGKTLEFQGDQHLSMHPFGKVPVLLHNDTAISETATILRYLDRAFGEETLQGNNFSEKMLCDQWCALSSIYIDQALVRNFMLELAFPKGENGQPRFDVIAKARPKALEAASIVSQQLGKKAYLIAESFTLADAILAPILAYNAQAPEAFNLVAEFENLTHYSNRLLARASSQKVLTAMKSN